jgi:hypothetical protein
MPFASGKSILEGLLGRYEASKFNIVGSGEDASYNLEG